MLKMGELVLGAEVELGLAEASGLALEVGLE